MEQDRRPSQRQIAASAGVSVSTVSRALSHAPGISEGLRLRIGRLAAEMGYAGVARGRDEAASGGAALDAAAILVPLDLFSSDASGFYHDILKGAEDELRARAVAVELVFLDDPVRHGEAVTRCCAERPEQGLLLFALDQPDVIAAVVEAGLPAVLVNGSDPEMRIAGVTPANDRGARLAARHLLDLGHRRIAVVTARNRSTLAERYRSFRRTILEGGGEHDDSLVLELPRLHPDLAFEAMRGRLAARPIDFTAVLCGNDMVAAGVLRALNERDIPVPGACSVMGFDDVTLAGLSRPRLTTIEIDRAAIGRLSARQLLQTTADPTLPLVDLQLGCYLIARESTAAPPSPRTAP